MAKKSKTQRAKASAARQARRTEREQQPEEIATETSTDAADKPKKTILKKADPDAGKKAAEKDAKQASAKKSDEKPKKKRFKFFREVKAELKRVTWPTRADVLRWSVVVVAALVFFGVFVAVLDNAVITPLLVFISGIGA